MNVYGYSIKFKDCEWFKDKEPLILDAKNPVEREQRLIWLKQGVLNYHLKGKSIPYGSNGGCPIEKQMFLDFIKDMK